MLIDSQQQQGRAVTTRHAGYGRTDTEAFAKKP